jgi:predicted metal-dependent hydrolase
MDDRLREGIDLFNHGRFFQSHEILETFYQDTEDTHKPFIEGLIQLAVAFRIFSEFGEIKGPVRMIYQALIRFENYQPTFLQVGVKELSEAMEAWAKAAETAGGAPISQAIPKIPLQRFSFFS